MNPLDKIWDVEIDLLEKFKGICEKYKLSYGASSGTLLGAVRHQGFIPWDDDIDLFLPWDHYKKLLEVAPNECQYPYFFQSFLTQEESEVSGCRLRRSDTTGFTKWEAKNVGPDYDRGIFIDIMPLFKVPDLGEERQVQKETVLFFWKCIRGYNAFAQIERREKPNEDYIQYIPYYKSICESMNITDIKWTYLNACAMAKGKTREVGSTASRIHYSKEMWDSECFKEYITLPFESTTIRCPKEYDRILTKQYGDWRTPYENGARHEMLVIDTETPWREFDYSRIAL